MRRIARYALFSLFISGFIFTGQAWAQEEPAEALELCPRFGQEVVRVFATFPSDKVSAGALLPIRATLSNLTERPLSGGTLLVKLVSKELADRDLARAEGAAVSRLVAATDISVPASGKAEREFSLSISESLPRGEYGLELVYALSDQFNLENPDVEFPGLANNKAVYTLTIDNQAGKSFAFIDPKSVSTEEGEVPMIRVALSNPGDAEAVVPVIWKSYAWSALSEKSLVDSKVELVKLQPNTRKTLAYRLDNTRHSLYQVVVQADSNGLRSIATVSVDGTKGESLIKTAGIAPFPAEGDVHAYACVYNVFSDDETERSIHLSVSDASGRSLGEGVFPAVKGVNDFQVTKPVRMTGGDVTLLASVVANGLVEQRVSRTFSCADFGGCAGAAAASSNDELLFATTLLAAGTGGLIALRYLLRHRKKSATAEPPTNIPQA